MTNEFGQWSHPLMEGLPRTGTEIEALSHRMIDTGLADIGPRLGDSQPIVRRMVHAAGDLSLAETIRVHPQAVEAGCAALRACAPIICDVHMLRSGITRTPNELICLIRDDDVIALSKQMKCTRAAASMYLLGERLNDAVVAIGNAPTAIWALLELRELRNIRPALVVGTPVGFVGAAESKQALMESDLCYVSNVGPRGGSAIAAAATNAIALMAVAE
jgi:precorrin-8X/cobalt-precorrin-8 methylmutase